MKTNLRLFKVTFTPLWPVPCGLIIAAETKEKALDIAKETITHTQDKPLGLDSLSEIPFQEGVIFYQSGDY